MSFKVYSLLNFSRPETTQFHTGMKMRTTVFIFMAIFPSVVPTYYCFTDVSKNEYVSSIFAQAGPANKSGHDISARRKVRLNPRRSPTTRVSPRISPLSYYVGSCAVIALWDFLFWMRSKFNKNATAMISDRFFSLQPWSGKKDIFIFLMRTLFYSLGHGNLFHFLGTNHEKESPFHAIYNV